MTVLHGQATIRFNGQHYETNDDATFTPGGTKNTSRTIGRSVYRSESYMASKLECKIPVTSDIDIIEIQEMSDVEIIFESNTGKTYVMSNCAQTADVSLQGGESGGEASATFEGEAAQLVE